LRDNLSGQKTGGRQKRFDCPSSFLFWEKIIKEVGWKNMRKRRPSYKAHGQKWSSEEMRNIVFLEMEELKEHEQIRPEYLEELKNEIISDGILKMPIAVDRNTYIILDGHHRLHALRKIGCKKIPVVLVDYQSPEIQVVTWREGEHITKDIIIHTALTGGRMPPKTSKHMIMVNGELQHISIIETVINIPLEKLK
jgi:hypothetical protein